MKKDDEILKRRLDTLWNYSLFDALTNRRSRRFGQGYELKYDTFDFTSDKEPIPLTDQETAVLAWAGHGISGLALGEAQLITHVHNSWNGRVHPAPCNEQHSYLLWVNDKGAFLYDPPDATKVVEIQDPTERVKIMQFYEEGTRQFLDHRPEFPDAGWLSSNKWLNNRPGSTLFFPVVDVAAEYINFMLYAAACEGYQVFDDRTGKPAGIGKWIDNGTLNGPNMTLSMWEIFVLNVSTAQCQFKAQNMALTAEAMGVGVLSYSGFTPMVILGGTPLAKGLEFNFVTGKDGMPNPVGKKGLVETFCPPYYKNMDDAVDALVEGKYGDNGVLTPGYKGPVPVKDKQRVLGGTKPPTKDVIQITKDFCNYVYDTYGRFPAFVDTIQAPIATLVHHVDEDFYAEYYPAEVLHERFHNHMKIWHE